MGKEKTGADPVAGSTKKNLPINDDEYSSSSIGTNEPVHLEHAPKSVESAPQEKEGPVESAAAKKNRKRKERERAKKAAETAAVLEEKPEETKKTDKKVAKHVREMQEKIARKKEAEERKEREREEKLRKEEEEKRKQEELERLAEEKKRMKKEREKQKILQKKQEGKPVTAKQKEAQRKLEAHRKQIEEEKLRFEASRNLQYSRKPQAAVIKATENVDTKEPEIIENNEVEKDEDEDWEAKRWDDDDDDANLKSSVKVAEDPQTKPVSKNETEPTLVAVGSKKPEEKSLRSPICCIMGHVDAGKTKLLDCIRGTSVQEGEAGGITQQIGATYFPAENIRQKTKELKADAKLNVPGLLVIDTPGHEAFNNLRSRGSGLCDIAILVVDIMHGLEPQTIESLNLLKSRNAEYIIALNKVDRLYGWKASKNAPIRATLKKQSNDVKREFKDRLTQVKTAFMEQGINTALYYENREMGETISIVPTSAITGEGIPDMLLLLVQWGQKMMIEKLTFQNKVQCNVLDVKVVEGHGTTIDVLLVNGVLREGDKIVVCGMNGPIVTSIRALLTPHPMKELRVKGTYLQHKDIKAAQGLKIAAHGLEHAIASAALHVVGAGDALDEVKKSAMEDMQSVMKKTDKSGEGVYVQSSDLGSVEALLNELKTPVSGIGIGPLHRKDVMKAGVMLEKKKKEYAVILAFNVVITPDAQKHADETGVKIFSADVIYHLSEQYNAYVDSLKEEKKTESAAEAVFPCVLKIGRNFIIRKKNPIMLGVQVVQGIAKVGTPLCIPSKGFIDIGRIASIQKDNAEVGEASKGQSVCIKIVASNYEEQKIQFGRHFKDEDELVSHISRRSIEVMENSFRDEVSSEVWELLVKLKKIFRI